MDHLVVRIVFLLACVCVDVCATVQHVTKKRACVWMCGNVCAHTGCLLSGVRAKRTPAFCHFNPPYPVTHWSRRSHRSFFDRDQRVLTRTLVNLAMYRLMRMTGHQSFERHFWVCFWLKICFKLDCHLCWWKSIIAQSVSLYCTVPWYIPLQLKHRRTFQRFFKDISVKDCFQIFYFHYRTCSYVSKKQLNSAMEPCHSC